ncbi:MAG: alpha/beta hydrolase [Kofleriaceae bacterium]
MKFLLAAALLVACGKHDQAPPAPTKTEAPKHDVTSEDVTFKTKAGDDVPGTLVKPNKGPAKLPAIVMFQGSGPTDRDWGSRMLKSDKTPSGKLLAEELALHDVIVLRFDKAMVGGNKSSLANQTIDIYRDEAQAALAYLRTRPDVDPAKLYVLGHSEGGVHVMRTAIAEGDQLHGVMLISTSGRTLHALLISQVSAKLDQVAPSMKDGILGPFKQALDDFAAGKPIDPKKASVDPGLQMLLAGIATPPYDQLGRSLLEFDPIATVQQVKQPILIVNGDHDAQVDATLDAKALDGAARTSNKDVTLVIAPGDSHMLRPEPRSIADQVKNPLGGTESDDIDPAIVTAIADWLAKH